MSQPNLFDPNEGQRKKDEGMRLAAMNRDQLLQFARDYGWQIARRNGGVDADDVYEKLDEVGIDVKRLGPAAGSIFSGDKRFVFTGEWKPSRRTSNHGRPIRVWRLK